MDFPKKLLLNVSFFLLSGAICWALGYPGLTGGNGWYPLAGMAAWPCLPWIFGVPCFSNYVGWPGGPWPWLALAAVLLWLFARQFWTPSRRAVWLGLSAIALWWFAGLFLIFYYDLATV